LFKTLGNKLENLLFDIIKKYYVKGELPDDFVKSRTITIPKKVNANECGNYITISILLSHGSKILLNIIKNRLREKIEDHLSENQFGFRRG